LHPLGALPAFRKNPVALFQRLWRDYGDIVRVRMAHRTLYLVSRPEDVRVVLQDNAKNYCRGKLYERFRVFMGGGILTSDGEKWLRNRRAAQPAFQRSHIEAMVPKMTATIAHVLERWEPRARTGELFDVVPDVTRMAFCVLGRALLDQDIEAPYEELEKTALTALKLPIEELGTLSSVLPLWAPTSENRRIRALHSACDKVVDFILRGYREGRAAPDNLLAIIQANDRDGQLTEAQLRDELMTTLLAGYETTSTGMAWMLFALARHPDVRRDVEAEIDLVVGDRTPTLDDLPKLSLARRVMDETLRLYPPIWGFPRDAIADDVIGGVRIEAGATVMTCPFVTHRRPELFPDPERFDPDRFLPEPSAARPRFAYFPFGGGPRQCIGNHFALLESHLFLTMALQRYRIDIDPHRLAEFGPLLSLRPMNGIQVTLRRRGA
jgi:cytochrome P450